MTNPPAEYLARHRKIERGDFRSEEVKAAKKGFAIIGSRLGGRGGFRGGELQALHKAGCRDINRFHRSWKGPIQHIFYYDTVKEALECAGIPNDGDFKYRNIYHQAWGDVDCYPCTGCNLKKKAMEGGD